MNFALAFLHELTQIISGSICCTLCARNCFQLANFANSVGGVWLDGLIISWFISAPKFIQHSVDHFNAGLRAFPRLLLRSFVELLLYPCCLLGFLFQALGHTFCDQLLGWWAIFGISQLSSCTVSCLYTDWQPHGALSVLRHSGPATLHPYSPLQFAQTNSAHAAVAAGRLAAGCLPLDLQELLVTTSHPLGVYLKAFEATFIAVGSMHGFWLRLETWVKVRVVKP